jgi:nicotinate-nucleotide adenylyltransferase
MNAIGILGGTFDPVHIGHSRIALDIADKCGLEVVLFVPNAQSPLRDVARAGVTDRLAMLKAVVSSDPRLQLDDRELHRPPPSYTVDTLAALREDLPGRPLCFILGMDAFMQFHRWHRWQDILQLAHLVVARRPGSELHITDKALQTVFAERITDNVDILHQQLSGRIYICDVTLVDVSATQVRENVTKGLPLQGLVTEPVAQYITEHRLYQ